MRRADAELQIENYQIYEYYRERLISMALAQFEWTGLPETCDSLYFERKLLFQGTAAFLKPQDTDIWLSLPYVMTSHFNGYGYPNTIEGVDYNGRHIPTSEFLICYDNVTTLRGGNCGNLIPKIDLYARLMWEAHNTFRSNLRQQITPYVVTGSKNQKLSIINAMNRVFGFQPVIQMRNDDDLKKFQVMDMKTPYIGNELLLSLQTLWAEALHMLGIASGTTKRERLSEMELTMNRQESAVSMHSRLSTRIDFCNKFNKLTGMGIAVNLVEPATDLEVWNGQSIATETLEEDSEVIGE